MKEVKVNHGEKKVWLSLDPSSIPLAFVTLVHLILGSMIIAFAGMVSWEERASLLLYKGL